MKKLKSLLLMLILVVFIGGCSCSSNDGCECPNDNQSTEEQYMNVVTDYSELFKGVAQSVVKITVQKGSYSATGSGVVFFQEGDKAYILTNAHVVKDVNSTYDVNVIFSDEDGFESGLVEKVETSNIYKNTDEDVAVLEISKSSKYKVAKIGDSDKLDKGEFVFTVGSPFGKFNYTSAGNVMSKNVPVVLKGSEVTSYVIVSDAVINQGNSGGALFNKEGELVGITSFRYDKDAITNSPIYQMYGSLAINHAHKVAKSLITKGEYVRPTLNLELESINEMGIKKDSYGISRTITSGVYVVNGLENAIAPQSVITAVNDVEVRSVNEFYVQLLKYDVGQTIRLTIKTKDDSITREGIQVTLHA